MYFGGEVMLTKESIVTYLENEAVRPLSEVELAEQLGADSSESLEIGRASCRERV